MPKDAYDKLKIWSEVLKNNRPILVMAFTAISSISTNAVQYFTNSEVEHELAETQQQVTAVARHFTKKVVVVRKSDCGDCIKRIEKLERFQKRWN